MTVKKPADSTSSEPVATPTAGSPSTVGSAFDAFVERGLHDIYDRVLNEPIPEELLRLIDTDRRK